MLKLFNIYGTIVNVKNLKLATKFKNERTVTQSIENIISRTSFCQLIGMGSFRDLQPMARFPFLLQIPFLYKLKGHCLYLPVSNSSLWMYFDLHFSSFAYFYMMEADIPSGSLCCSLVKLVRPSIYNQMTKFTNLKYTNS